MSKIQTNRYHGSVNRKNLKHDSENILDSNKDQDKAKDDKVHDTKGDDKEEKQTKKMSKIKTNRYYGPANRDILKKVWENILDFNKDEDKAEDDKKEDDKEEKQTKKISKIKTNRFYGSANRESLKKVWENILNANKEDNDKVENGKENYKKEENDTQIMSKIKTNRYYGSANRESLKKVWENIAEDDKGQYTSEIKTSNNEMNTSDEHFTKSKPYYLTQLPQEKLKYTGRVHQLMNEPTINKYKKDLQLKRGDVNKYLFTQPYIIAQGYPKSQPYPKFQINQNSQSYQNSHSYQNLRSKRDSVSQLSQSLAVNYCNESIVSPEELNYCKCQRRDVVKRNMWSFYNEEMSATCSNNRHKEDIQNKILDVKSQSIIDSHIYIDPENLNNYRTTNYETIKNEENCPIKRRRYSFSKGAKPYITSWETFDMHSSQNILQESLDLFKSQTTQESPTHLESIRFLESKTFLESQICLSSQVCSESQLCFESQIHPESPINPESQINRKSQINPKSQLLLESQLSKDQPVANEYLNDEVLSSTSSIDRDIQMLAKGLPCSFDSSQDLSLPSDVVEIEDEYLFTGDELLLKALIKIRDKKYLLFNDKHRKEQIPKDVMCRTILGKIDNILYRLSEAEKDNRPKRLRIRNRKNWSNCVFVKDRIKLRSNGSKLMIIDQSKASQRQKFDVIIFLLTKIRQLVSTNRICTKRQIYYEHINFLRSQKIVDECFMLVSCLLNVPPWELHIYSSSKGLVFGNLKIYTGDEEVVDCNVKGGCLIPQDASQIVKIEADAYFILILEKDSVFQRLLDEELPKRIPCPFIMITGKGYPDINTRLFVKKLWIMVKAPVFILVDADPYGIEIMGVYRFGGLQTSFFSDHLTVPKLRWIGIHPSEIKVSGIQTKELTDGDQKKIEDLLTRPYMSKYPRIKEELNVMAKQNVKAEIEGAILSANFLSKVYLPNKLYDKDYF